MIWIEQAKLYMFSYAGMSRDALHIHIGIAVYFALHWVLRRKLGSRLPLAIVFAFCIAGEIVDIHRVWRLDQWQQPLENLHDIANTMFWPVVFTAFARWRNRRAEAALDSDQSSDRASEPELAANGDPTT